MALALLILSINLFSAASNAWIMAGGMRFAGFLAFLIAGGLVAFIIIYFKAVLKVIDTLRNNILGNVFNPLREIKIFTILTYIGPYSVS